jgi:ERCC4-type nuclease
MGKYTLIFDNREHKLIEKFKDSDIDNFSITTEALKVGDIVIKNTETDHVLLIFERKTCSDLLSSINDGRYREQKARLCANYSLNQICYLIENGIDNSLNKYRKNGTQIVLGALVNKMFRDNIKILRTDSIDETKRFLLTICKKVNTNPEFFQTSDVGVGAIDNPTPLPTNNPDNTYVHNIKLAKKDNITPTTFSIISLSIIPGVSTKIAETVMEIYKNINNLVVKINNNDANSDANNDANGGANGDANSDATIIKELTNIKITHNSSNKRNLGPVLAKRIVSFLKTS